MDCYAKDLGNCSGKISREHVISEGILGDKVGVQGLSWCLDEEVFIGKNSFTIKHLCQKHNSDLSPYDSGIQKLFHSMDHMLYGKKDFIYTVDGRLVEKWILKTAVNLLTYYSPNSDFKLDNKVVLDYLFRGKSFTRPFGMAVAYNQNLMKGVTNLPGKIYFNVIASGKGDEKIIDTFIMIYKSLPLVLEIENQHSSARAEYLTKRNEAGYVSDSGSQYVWHPLEFLPNNKNLKRKVMLKW